MSYGDISRLVGKTLIEITGAEVGSEKIIFVVSETESYEMFHDQNCWEYVDVEDVCGDIEDLIGVPILEAEEASSAQVATAKLLYPQMVRLEQENESHTWTFYRLGTIKGSVVLRWFGASNGYYSEDVSFRKVDPNDPDRSGWDVDDPEDVPVNDSAHEELRERSTSTIPF